MIYITKVCGKKIAYDSASGAVIHLTSLANKMLGALSAPLPPLCPTSLRYELAKYDSQDVTETYDSLYELQESGLLFANDDGFAKLILGGENGAENTDEIAEILKTLKANGAKEVSFIGNSGMLDTANALAKEIF